MNRLLLLALAFTPALAAQTPVFEVASIKPHKPDPTGSGGLSAQHGRLNFINVTVKNLITSAYELHDFQVSGGPAWIDSERYDLVAKAENDAGGKELWMMVRPLLAERFKLAVHQETREMQVYALVVAKGGPKLQAVENGNGGLTSRLGQVSATAVPVSRLADFLAGPRLQLGHPVVDRTGLSGSFTFTLQWTPDDLFSALQEQLGLKLEASKGMVNVIVVDHAEKPSEN